LLGREKVERNSSLLEEGAQPEAESIIGPREPLRGYRLGEEM